MRFAMICAGFCGSLAVALGAFGAHGLGNWLKTVPDGVERLAWWHTAAHYQLVHAVLLGVFAALQTRAPSSMLRKASVAVLVGTVFFSGSLYAMTLTNMKVLGAITPIGGVGFITAWVMLAVHGWRTAGDSQ
jgi:uncharacterized membrane protein YgdD (TMEM256/DUF423 family)